MILQEVSSIPQDLISEYSWLSKKARSKGGGEQIFSTVILSRLGPLNGYLLSSSKDWIKKELIFYLGNIMAGEITLPNINPIRIMSVYSPAWAINNQRLNGTDISSVKLTYNENLFCTELVWATLQEEVLNSSASWIVAGDFNSSSTFDYVRGIKPRGNQEIINRMNDIGMTECLYTYNGRLIPTFKNAKDGKVVHQMDHVYVSPFLFQSLRRCYVADSIGIFENNLSDHLPIISVFEI